MKHASNVEADKAHHYVSEFGFIVVFLFFLVQRFDAVIEALEKGQAVDLSGLPPSPGQGEESEFQVDVQEEEKRNI